VVGLLMALLAGVTLAGVRELRRSAGCRLLVGLTLLRFLLLSVAANAKFTYYMVHMVPFFAALIGVAACHAIARKERLARTAALAALLAYFVVQGATLWHRTVTVNGYATEYQPMLSFIKSVTHPNDEVVGSAELGFGLGFYNPRLADDVWLGYWSHRRPTIVVVDRWYYEEVMKVATQRGFPIPNYFEQLLDDKFDLIKEFKSYKIYRRRN